MDKISSRQAVLGIQGNRKLCKWLLCLCLCPSRRTTSSFYTREESKQSTENPSEDAWATVPQSVWIEGKCRKYRWQEDGKRVPEKLHRGWVLLGESRQGNRIRLTFSAYRCRKRCLKILWLKRIHVVQLKRRERNRRKSV